MTCLHIILTTEDDMVRVAGQSYPVLGPSLLLMAGTGTPELSATGRVYPVSAMELQLVYRDMQQLLPSGGRGTMLDIPRNIPAEDGVLRAAGQLAEADRCAMLRFVLSYCLAVDGEYCAALLRYLVAADLDLFDFIHRHRLQPWPVARYADALGLPLRKFNQLFKEKYGVSAKHWLLAQRLEYARGLLETTTKKVIDVALESGFGNPAHFSDSFRRHFRMSPSDVRREAPTVPLAASLLF
ncbi:helix-turn-helix transcriptional regulator [Chromobacterium vaccinii]|uniref:AraC family transcriptional regulator n=1 Tax=Chromobacterium vaccinii TaxID=1108595 RepID=UPI003260CE12